MPLERIRRADEAKPWYGDFPVYFIYTHGIAGERFFREIMENEKFYGTRCPECGVVFFPARLFCERCLSKLGEWVEIPNKGSVYTWTLSYRDVDGKPLDKPVLIAFVKFEGTEGGIIHRLEGIEPDKVYFGLEVRAVFSKEKRGDIRDISHFEPI